MIHAKLASHQSVRRRAGMLTLVRVRSLSPKRCLFLAPRNGKNGYQSYRLSKKVGVPPALLYQVIADVSKYQEFVPFVTESFVNERNLLTSLPTEAGLRVGWKQFDEMFTCTLECLKNKIVAESISILLFDCLHNEWNLKEAKSRFTDEPSTLVELSLTYKFKNPLYNTLSSLFHEQVSSIMMKAFEDRAMKIRAVYKDDVDQGIANDVDKN